MKIIYIIATYLTCAGGAGAGAVVTPTPNANFDGYNVQTSNNFDGSTCVGKYLILINQIKRKQILNWFQIITM